MSKKIHVLTGIPGRPDSVKLTAHFIEENPPAGHIRVADLVVAPCRADERMLRGSKIVEAMAEVILGHEAVGVIQAVGEGVIHLHVGDVVVLRPHVYGLPHEHHADRCPHPGSEACLVTCGTQHAGMGPHGFCAEEVVYRSDLVDVVAPASLAKARVIAPDLPPHALWVVTEHVACVRECFDRAESASLAMLGHALPKKILIQGVGQLGALAAMEAMRRGFMVIGLYDIDVDRARFVQELISHDPRFRGKAVIVDPGEVDVWDCVWIANSNVTSIRQAEEFVAKPEGVIVAFAGFNEEALDSTGSVDLERLHRYGLSAVVGAPWRIGRVLYVGRSGYSPPAFKKAIEIVSSQLEFMNALTSGVVRGMRADEIAGRLGAPTVRSGNGPIAPAAFLGGAGPEHRVVVILP